MPATPKLSPKNMPDTVPSLFGNSSCEYSSMAGNADESMKPAPKLITTVRAAPQWGMSRLNGAVPTSDRTMTRLRP